MEHNSTLATTAHNLINNLLQVRPKEVVVITADQYNDPTVIDAMAQAIKQAGGKVLSIWMPAPDGVGMAADAGIAGEALVGAITNADCWIEFNKVWLLGSQTYIRIMNEHKPLRHINLTGASETLINNCIGKVNYSALTKLGNRLAHMIANANMLHMSSPTGMDVHFRNLPERPVLCELGGAHVPGSHMLPGQIAWTPEIPSINGTIVFDGALAPVCGIPSAPVLVEVVNGTAKRFSGCAEAKDYEDWLRSYDDPQMFSISHAGLGINPGAVLTGDILSDQRVWGSATWAFGSIGANLVPPNGVVGSSHSDCVCLDISLSIDNTPIYTRGQLVHPALIALSEEL